MNPYSLVAVVVCIVGSIWLYAAGYWPMTLTLIIGGMVGLLHGEIAALRKTVEDFCHRHGR